MTSQLHDTYSFLLEKTARVMRQHSARVLKKAGAGVTVEQWAILKALQEKGDMSQVELAELTFKDKPTVTRILDLLVRKGLLERQTDDEDRRKFIIVLTKKGKNKVAELLPLIMSIRERG